MGYSGRYHAASLAAVFIALAIGILIGIGLADDVVSSASQELENSLRDERDAARDQAADLQDQLDQEQEFSDAATRALIAGKLRREKVALIFLGGAPDDDDRDTANAAIDVVGKAGGTLGSVSSIPLPPDVDALVGGAGSAFADAKRDPIALRNLGRLVGLRLVGGGPLIEELKPDLFSTFNGDLTGVSDVVLVNNAPTDLDGQDQVQADAFERGLLEGLSRASQGAVGVELSSTDPTTLDPFKTAGIPTVDDVDKPAGQVAMVYVLDGASGDFGVKDGADSLIPEPLLPRRPGR
jgi:hypothetical protein